MPTLALSRSRIWQAVATVLILHVLDDIVTRHLWHPVELFFLSFLPDGYLEDDTKEAFIAASRATNHRFYFVEIPRGLIEDLVIQILAYHSQIFLDRILPGRPKSTPEKSKANDDKSMRGTDEMETEIMQKLIAEGRVKPVGISWRNILLRWLLDDTLGTLCFAVIGFLLHCATRLHPPAQIAEEVSGGIWNTFLRYWFSASPFFSLLGLSLIHI